MIILISIHLNAVRCLRRCRKTLVLVESREQVPATEENVRSTGTLDVNVLKKPFSEAVLVAW